MWTAAHISRVSPTCAAQHPGDRLSSQKRTAHARRSVTHHIARALRDRRRRVACDGLTARVDDTRSPTGSLDRRNLASTSTHGRLRTTSHIGRIAVHECTRIGAAAHPARCTADAVPSGRAADAPTQRCENHVVHTRPCAAHTGSDRERVATDATRCARYAARCSAHATGRRIHSAVARAYVGHGYVGHGYVGHGYVGHGYVSHGYVGHGYVSHGYVGHGYVGHGYVSDVFEYITCPVRRWRRNRRARTPRHDEKKQHCARTKAHAVSIADVVSLHGLFARLPRDLVASPRRSGAAPPLIHRADALRRSHRPCVR
jgi:hypothetical protein